METTFTLRDLSNALDAVCDQCPLINTEALYEKISDELESIRKAKIARENIRFILKTYFRTKDNALLRHEVWRGDKLIFAKRFKRKDNSIQSAREILLIRIRDREAKEFTVDEIAVEAGLDLSKAKKALDYLTGMLRGCLVRTETGNYKFIAQFECCCVSE